MIDCMDCRYQENMCKWPCDDCVKGDKWEERPLTNADKIRAMTDEELAEWVGRYGDCILTHCCAFDICVPTMEDMSCKDWILKWLKQEVKE